MQPIEVMEVEGSRPASLQARAERTAALVRLADEHLDAAYRLARAILREPSDAQDATHDALIRASRKWSTLRDPSRFAQWFDRILINICLIGFGTPTAGRPKTSLTSWRSSPAMEIAAGTSTGPGTAVTVAGYDAMYRRLDALREQWIVDIEGTLIAIQLIAEPDTSEADLAEAHAIIDWMRTEPQDTDLGFQLVFRLATDDWDSG